MPYYYRLVDGWPLHVFLVWLKFTKFTKFRLLCVAFMVLLGEPNHQSPCVKPMFLPPRLVVAVASSLWTGFLLLHSAS